ncbi:hypothetical protein G9A89_002967 [Geosiphon pyriformis]|nr:hypothetical protein G9A89_002967 [Geosiphon pyriformis]
MQQPKNSSYTEEDQEKKNHLEFFKLPSDLEASVSAILQINDPLDSSDFNPIEYINQILPDEQSLAFIEITSQKLQIKLRQIENEIHEFTRKRNNPGNQGTEELVAVKKAIEELFTRIKEIKQKATKSELMVQEITQDIKSLDHAKRHLTISMTVLKRLQMLVDAIKQLKEMAQLKQYKEISQLLQAVLELVYYFKPYKGIKQVSDLLSSVTALQIDLRQRIFRDFEARYIHVSAGFHRCSNFELLYFKLVNYSFAQDGSLIVQEAPLADACLVIEIMGSDIRLLILPDFFNVIKRRLLKYGITLRISSSFIMNEIRIFALKIASLENLSKRYAYLTRALKGYDKDHATIFPSQWRLSEILCIKFCELTREDFSKILSKSNNELDAKALMKSLQLTIELENALDKRFDNRDLSILRDGQVSKQFIFSKSISKSFHPYLRIYIEAENKTIFEMINSYRTESIPEDESVLPSSTDLFYFYRETLVKFAQLSTSEPFFDLANMFGKWLKIYASDVLIGRLPREERRPMKLQELRIICTILNTADYCCITTRQLEDKLKETIDEDYKNKISLEIERETFLNVATTSIKSLVRGIETCYEDSLILMSKKSWGDLESVGDQSEYVSLFQSTLRTCVVNVHKDITSNTYFRAFCDKFVDSFVSRFISNLTKCKPISEVGAEQLLLDVHSLKTSLLEMPTLGMENPAPTPNTFVKIINRGISKIETILKLILTPHEPPDGLVENYLLLVADRNPNNIQKIMDLKGLKKFEQQPIIDIFQQRIQENPTLQENSNILSLLTWTSTIIPQSFPIILNNASLLASDRISIGDRSGAAATRFNEGVRKVLAGRSWLRKDGNDE